MVQHDVITAGNKDGTAPLEAHAMIQASAGRNVSVPAAEPC